MMQQWSTLKMLIDHNVIILLVNQSLSLEQDQNKTALSLAVLPGIVLAYLGGIPIIIGAFASGFFCSLATGYIKENCRVKEDTVMGIVYSGMFAFGLVLFSKVDTEQHLNHILFGSVLGTTHSELIRFFIIKTF